jgi:hypothetical protein
MEQETEVEMVRPKYRRFKLFTNGEIGGIDAMAIMCELLGELPPNEQRAAINYVVDRFITNPPRS